MNNIVAEKNYIASKLQGQNANIRYENLSQSYLRGETLLGTQTSIKFNVQAGQVPTPTASETLLNLNDQFVITHIFVGLKQIASDTPTALQHMQAKIYTYESPQVFTATNAANVATIYNGSLSLTANRKEFIPEFPVRNFRRVPDTQQGAVTISSGTVTTPVATGYAGGLDGVPNGLYGNYPTDVILIDGRQTLDILIDLRTSVTFDTTDNSIYAVFMASGYLVVNSKD